jgi:HSP20 family protein
MGFGLARCQPATDLAPVQNEAERLFNDFWGGGFLWHLDSPGVYAPAMDVEETPEAWVVKTELPGMKREGIRVQVYQDLLEVTGERKGETEQKENKLRRSERFYGKFRRVLRLPMGVEGSKGKARYEDGVLSIHLPKQPEARAKELSIEVQ